MGMVDFTSEQGGKETKRASEYNVRPSRKHIA